MARVIPYFPAVLAIFHVVGFYLFTNDSTYASLTPINLMLCGVLVFLTESWRSMWVVYILIFILGYVAELVGVKTGLLFGNYYYSDVLGPKIFDIPIIIGVNWCITVACACSIFISFQLPLILKVLGSGLVATALDAIIEPVAIGYHFWVWENDTVPLFNYICWFIISAFFAWMYLIKSKSRNNTAFFLSFIWLLFFVGLNLI